MHAEVWKKVVHFSRLHEGKHSSRENITRKIENTTIKYKSI